jgi:CIC family chloride channel protein
VALHGGRMRPRVVIVKALTASICIGSGGSAGREGPIAHIGAALGSTLGQILKLSDERIRSLAACGTAGAVAATFNAPIAGSLFALEVVLGKLHATHFGAVVISAVTADVVAHIFEGDLRTFALPIYRLVSPWELALYTLLGGIAAIASAGFGRLLYRSADLWDGVRLPAYLKPALGGTLLGVIGMLTFQVDGFPRIFGVGYPSITEALFNRLTLDVVVALFFLKMLATILTLGSGGSGGVFAPSLFMGAMMGAAFGRIVNQLFPAITAPAGAYALVGMAAFFSGAAHAPASAILTLFEMTGEYSIILPLMLATVMSTFISRIISRDSVYTLKLTRRGVHLGEGQESDLMHGVTVSEVMASEIVSVSPELPLLELEALFLRSHRNGLPVLDEAGKLIGIVCIRDLERAEATGPLAGRTVADIATIENLVTVTPEEAMDQALRRLGGQDIGHLPVVAERGSRRLVGMLHRRDIIRAYNRAITKQAQSQHRDEALRLEKLDDASFAQITVAPDAPVVGLRIREVDWPGESLIVSVRREGKLQVAHSDTLLRAGDQVTVFAESDCLPVLHEVLSGSKPGATLGR